MHIYWGGGGVISAKIQLFRTAKIGCALCKIGGPLFKIGCTLCKIRGGLFEIGGTLCKKGGALCEIGDTLRTK